MQSIIFRHKMIFKSQKQNSYFSHHEKNRTKYLSNTVFWMMGELGMYFLLFLFLLYVKTMTSIVCELSCSPHPFTNTQFRISNFQETFYKTHTMSLCTPCKNNDLYIAWFSVIFSYIILTSMVAVSYFSTSLLPP